jgi:hypothetical protein
MKIEIKKAMEELHRNENVKDGYSVIQVSLSRNGDGEDKLSWKIYGYDAKAKDSEWTDESDTFELAVDCLIKKFEKAREPENKFVVEE